MKLWLTLWAIAGCACAANAGIRGHVTNAQRHEPVRRALIRVSGAKQQWTEFTDGEGRFQFASPVRGEYRLAAHRDGFSDRYYKVELSDFNEGQDLPIELRPQGLITGKVVDGSGQPVGAAAAAETNDWASIALRSETGCLSGAGHSPRWS